MKIEVGIYKKPNNKPPKNGIGNIDGWKLVCEQERVPHKFTDRPDCPVTVFDGETPDWFESYIADGGVGIITDCHSDFLPFESSFVTDATIEYADFTGLDAAVARVQCIARIFDGEGLGKITLHESRKKKYNINPDEYPVFIYQSYGKGGCWYTGLPMPRLLTSLGDTLRRSASFSNFTERIVSVDKQHIIKTMRSILIKAFNGRGLPYVHLWYYPENYRSVFTFRIDIDGVFGDNVANISKAAKDNGLTLMFFANKSLCENEEGRISDIDPMHKIGNHAEIHNLYTDYASNLNNIEECRQWLDELGVPNGPWFAAPRGMWNYNLHKALEESGYIYSSDFGLCIDGLPFFPYYKGIRTKTLQIPVNPFSVERAALWKLEEDNSQITPEFVSDFFSRVIEDNYSRYMPITLYSHPERFGKMADYVFKEICKKLEGLNVWKTTLSEFAQWWLRRDNTEYSVEYDETTKKITISGHVDSDICIKEII